MDSNIETIHSKLQTLETKLENIIRLTKLNRQKSYISDAESSLNEIQAILQRYSKSVNRLDLEKELRSYSRTHLLEKISAYGEEISDGESPSLFTILYTVLNKILRDIEDYDLKSKKEAALDEISKYENEQEHAKNSIDKKMLNNASDVISCINESIIKTLNYNIIMEDKRQLLTFLKENMTVKPKQVGPKYSDHLQILKSNINKTIQQILHIYTSETWKDQNRSEIINPKLGEIEKELNKQKLQCIGEITRELQNLQAHQ